jgi:hypothetical protein
VERNPYVAIENGRPGTISCRVHYYAQVTSTQDVAKHFAQDGAAHGTAIIADRKHTGMDACAASGFRPPGSTFTGSRRLSPSDHPASRACPVNEVTLG